MRSVGSGENGARNGAAWVFARRPEDEIDAISVCAAAETTNYAGKSRKTIVRSRAFEDATAQT
jgi:hypothetical protein